MKNLIKNHTFAHHAEGWEIINDEDVTISDNIVEINRDKSAKGVIELWSQSIAVYPNKNYLLSFDVWVADMMELGNPDVAIILRGTNERDKFAHADAVTRVYPSLKQSGVKDGQWQTIQKMVNTPAKYAKVGVWFKTGHVKIKNISLVELSSDMFFHEKNGVISYVNQYQLEKPVFFPLGQLISSDRRDEYDMELTVKIDDISGFFGEDSFFVVAESDQDFDLSNLDFDDVSINAQKLSINFENLTSNKWKHISNSYKFDRKHVIYGALLTGKGKAEFKDIKFEVNKQFHDNHLEKSRKHWSKIKE